MVTSWHLAPARLKYAIRMGVAKSKSNYKM